MYGWRDSSLFSALCLLFCRPQRIFQLRGVTIKLLESVNPENIRLASKEASYPSIKGGVTSFILEGTMLSNGMRTQPLPPQKYLSRKHPGACGSGKTLTQKVIYMVTFTAFLPTKCNFPSLHCQVVITLYFQAVHDEIRTVLVKVIYVCL